MTAFTLAMVGRRTGATALVGVALLAGCTRPPARPNVLLVVVDTLRQDRLGVYGATRPTSPALDSLASRSLVFEQAVSTGDNTVLSHSAIFSGRYPRLDQRQPEGAETLPEVFHAAGYGTYGVAANPLLTRKGSWSRGFDGYLDQPVPAAVLRRLSDRQGHAATISVRSAEHVIDRAFELLAGHRRRSDDQPWFLFLNLLDPHDPYDGGHEWTELFRRSPSQIDGVLRPRDSRSLFRWLASVAPTLNREDVARINELYDAEVRFVDSQLARLFAHLDEAGEADRTIILVTSDHGELLGEHGLFTHGLGSYDAELQVPFILHVPWLGHEGQRVGGMVESIDVGPTLLGLAGVDWPSSFTGRPAVSSDGELSRETSSMTLHFHRPRSPDRLRSLGFAARSFHSHVAIRSPSFKILLFDNGEFQIEGLPAGTDPTPDSGRLRLDELVGLIDGAAGKVSDLGDSGPEVEDALRALGYIE